MKDQANPILVIGGGIAGMTAAVEAAEVGYRVILVEKEPYLGGRVMRTHRYFPKMCPPTCGFEINVRRIRRNPRIQVYTLASVREITGEPGDFKARIKLHPRYVTGQHSLDDSIADQITSQRPNDFNMGLDKTKALYLPHDMAYPHDYVLDCEALSDEDAKILADICPHGAVDLGMMEKEFAVKVGAVVLATGWQPYDATRIENLGFGQCRNVITNVIMERLAAKGGHTGGEIIRPSDGAKAENVAFVQCAGSRDENHLPYCSAVCCMASLKQARYLREKNENSKATIFYIDIRTIGREEHFYYDLLDDENINFIKGKVAVITEDPASGDLTLDVEDTLSGETLHQNCDMAVLATGMVPNHVGLKLPFELKCDDFGFIHDDAEADGIYAVGCSTRPCDVSRAAKQSTAAALKAIQCVNRGV